MYLDQKTSDYKTLQTIEILQDRAKRTIELLGLKNQDEL